MSLSIAGVWAVDVWDQTVWADGVWREGIYISAVLYTMPAMANIILSSFNDITFSD